MDIEENQKLAERLKAIDQRLFDEKTNDFKNLADTEKHELKNSLSWLMMTDKIKNKARESIQHDMKRNDIIAIILAIIGVATNLIATSIYINFEMVEMGVNEHGFDTLTINIKPESTFEVRVLRWFTSVSTVLLIIAIVNHYRIRLKFQIRKNQLSPNTILCCSNLVIYMIFEIVFCLMHTPPYFENVVIPFPHSNPKDGVSSSNVDIDLILTSIIPSRIYLLLKYYSFYSSWGDDKAEKICIECNTLGVFPLQSKLS